MILEGLAHPTQKTGQAIHDLTTAEETKVRDQFRALR
jgi:hypothetical protein